MFILKNLLAMHLSAMLFALRRPQDLVDDNLHLASHFSLIED